MKTVIQALIDSVHYSLSYGFVENVLVERNLSPDEEYTSEVAKSFPYKGAKADCLFSLLQAVRFSEADKSVGDLTDKQRKAILDMANKLYEEIGEEPKTDGDNPTVYILD